MRLAVAILSSSLPAIQLPRLRLLYTDLHQTIATLLPSSHPVLLSLASPVPPTSSPLHSALALLIEVLQALRRRCAPSRDPEVDRLLAPLLAVPPLGVGTNDQLVVLVVDSFRNIISLSDTLKNDLTQAVLGSMSEGELTDVVQTQARARERDIVLDLHRRTLESVPAPEPKHDTARVQGLQVQWRLWVGSDHPSTGQRPVYASDWIPRLVQTLCSSAPVSCRPFDQSHNAIPLHFFFTASSLLYIQNCLQALVISASLNALVRIPTHFVTRDFIPRVWTLLKLMIDHDNSPPSAVVCSEESRISITNLADELLRARRMLPDPVTGLEEHELRTAVERILRLTDPVFVLLFERLRHSITEHLCAIHSQTWTGMKVADNPMKIRTGRSFLGDRAWDDVSLPPPMQVIKGYENDTLSGEINEVVRRLSMVIDWTQGIWSDAM